MNMGIMLSPVLRRCSDHGDEGGLRLGFRCPGCTFFHVLPVYLLQTAIVVPDPDDPDWTPPREFYGAKDGRWSWDGETEKPSIQPSILSRYEHMSEEAQAREKAFYEEHGRYLTHLESKYDVVDICHSFVTAGRIQFLDDCTHALRGKTVDMVPWDQDGDTDD